MKYFNQAEVVMFSRLASAVSDLADRSGGFLSPFTSDCRREQNERGTVCSSCGKIIRFDLKTPCSSCGTYRPEVIREFVSEVRLAGFERFSEVEDVFGKQVGKVTASASSALKKAVADRGYRDLAGVF